MRRDGPTPDTVAALLEALRAEVSAYRAEVAANRPETQAVLSRLDESLGAMCADMSSVMRRIYDITSDDTTQRWRDLARDILAEDATALRARSAVPVLQPEQHGEQVWGPEPETRSED